MAPKRRKGQETKAPAKAAKCSIKATTGREHNMLTKSLLEKPEPAKQKDGSSSVASEAEKKRLRRRDSDLLLVRHVWTVFADSRFRRRLLARPQLCGASDAGRNGA